MARNENPPIGRGEYESTAGALDNLIGKEWLFEDLDYSATGARPARTNRYVRCRLVKNVSGINLLPKRLARFIASGVNYGAQVDGYTATTAERGYPVDEFLPTAGVPDQAYFWIVVDGPAKVLAPLAGADFNGNISEGTRLVALTAATSGATTAGRVAVENITGSTQASDYTFIHSNLANQVGRALSAKTTANTNTDILVEVGKW